MQLKAEDVALAVLIDNRDASEPVSAVDLDQADYDPEEL